MDGLMDKDIITDAKEVFKQAEEAESENRDLWLDDFRFARLGEQWPAEVKKQRERDGRPCLTVNRLPSFIRQVTNDARLNKPSIVVQPVDSSGDKEVAEIMQGIIRNIEYSSNADIAYDTALDHSVTGGFGYFRIDIDYADDDVFEQDIRIVPVYNPLTVYGDPASSSADSSDWNKAFVTEMMTLDAFKERWGKDAQATAEDFAGKGTRDQLWYTDDSVRVAEYWTRSKESGLLLKLTDGQVMFEPEYLRIKDLLDVQGISVSGTRETQTYKVKQRIITGADVLEDNEWVGKYIPIVPVYGDEINIEGKRHFISLIRFSKDPQKMFNFWRTATTELVALAPKTPWVGPKGAFKTDSGKWQTANSSNHAYIEYDGAVPPQRQPFSGPPAGALQEALNASDDMKSIMGIYDASLGARSNETSGRAIMARQREGDVSTFNFIDNLSRSIRHAGRILVDLIPKVYSAPQVLRLIKDDQAVELVPVNQQFEDEKGVSKIYDLGNGKYDVTVKSGPSFTSKREEASSQMMELLKAFPAAAPIIGDLVAKNLDWPGADEIANRLKLMLPPQLQQAEKKEIPPEAQALIQSMDAQMQQLKQQMDMGMQEFQKLAGENQSLKAQVQSKEMDRDIKMTEADIKRRELDIKSDEINLKGAELELKKAEAMSTGVVIDGINPMVALMERINQGLESMSLTQAAIVEEITKPKPARRKVSKATKQKDGTVIMETVEE